MIWGKEYMGTVITRCQHSNATCSKSLHTFMYFSTISLVTVNNPELLISRVFSETRLPALCVLGLSFILGTPTPERTGAKSAKFSSSSYKGSLDSHSVRRGEPTYESLRRCAIVDLTISSPAFSFLVAEAPKSLLTPSRLHPGLGFFSWCL